MRTLTTPAFTLEPQAAAHASEMFDVLSDPAIYEFENAPPPSEPWLRERFSRLERRYSDDGTQTWLNWVIRLPDGRLAGYVQATLLGGGMAMIAYELASRYWRQGIGGAAVSAVIAELGHQYGISKLVAVLKAVNYRSSGLLQHLGFTMAPPDLAMKYADAPDEIVMCREVVATPEQSLRKIL